MRRQAKYWSIYLNDYLALMEAAKGLAERCARPNRHQDVGQFTEDLALGLERDIDMLHSLMEESGVKQSPLKVRAVRAGLPLGRLKLNGAWIRYSPLSRVVELEALCLLISSIQRFWESIERSDHPGAGRLDASVLAEGNANRLYRLLQLREKAAEAVL